MIVLAWNFFQDIKNNHNLSSNFINIKDLEKLNAKEVSKDFKNIKYFQINTQYKFLKKGK